MRDKSREIVEWIIRVNATQERLPLLLELRQRLEGLKIGMETIALGGEWVKGGWQNESDKIACTGRIVGAYSHGADGR